MGSVRGERRRRQGEPKRARSWKRRIQAKEHLKPVVLSSTRRPIPRELPKRDPREELRSRLEEAPAEHAEALRAGFAVLQALHDQGVLEIVRGVLDGGNKVLEIVVEATKTTEAISRHPQSRDYDQDPWIDRSRIT